MEQSLGKDSKENYPSTPREEKETSREVNTKMDCKIEIDVGKNNFGIGKTRYICGKKTRVCGSNKTILIGAYILISISSIVHSAIMCVNIILILLFIFRIPVYYFSLPAMIVLYIITAITFFYCIFSLIDVSTANPGFLPHGNLSREEFMKSKNIIEIKGVPFQLKYCDSCKIVRPPRSYHCSICGNCVKVHGKLIYFIIYFNKFI